MEKELHCIQHLKKQLWCAISMFLVAEAGSNLIITIIPKSVLKSLNIISSDLLKFQNGSDAIKRKDKQFQTV